VQPPGPQFHPQRVRESLQGELRSAIRPHEGRCDAPADGAHIDDAATPLAEQRQQRLRHRELARHIHLELRPELSQRQELERARDANAGVVHQTGQPRCADGRGDGLGRGPDRRLIGDVEQHRSEALRARRAQRGAVLDAAHAGEDLKVQRGQVQSAGPSDPARRPGHNHRSRPCGALRTHPNNLL
jgi:hypothetical protein